MAEGGQEYWTGENHELELSKFLLSRDNMALRAEIKSLRNLLDQTTELLNDLEDMAQASAAMDDPPCSCTVRDYIREGKLEVKHQLSLQEIKQDLHEKVTTIQLLERSTREHLATIEELRINKEEEGINHDPSLAVQIKSWWRCQAKKVSKGMGTFRLHFQGCFGLKTRRRIVVQPVGMLSAAADMPLASMDMLPAAVGMPEVSI